MPRLHAALAGGLMARVWTVIGRISKNGRYIQEVRCLDERELPPGCLAYPTRYELRKKWLMRKPNSPPLWLDDDKENKTS